MLALVRSNPSALAYGLSFFTLVCFAVVSGLLLRVIRKMFRRTAKTDDEAEIKYLMDGGVIMLWKSGKVDVLTYSPLARYYKYVQPHLQHKK